MKRLFKFVVSHKLIASISLLIIIFGGYFGYKAIVKKDEGVRYVAAAVEKGTLITSVSGGGQVSILDQIDIKPKASGEIVYIGARNDQEVRAGQLIAQLDTRDAEKTAWNAEINLANAKLRLEELKKEGGTSLAAAEESLTATYEDALNILTNAFKELSPMIPELETMFSESSYEGNQNDNDIDYYLSLVRTYSGGSVQLSYWAGGAEGKFLAIETQFEAIKSEYWSLNLGSPREQIERVLNQTYDTTRMLLDSARQVHTLIEKYQSLLEPQGLIPPISLTITKNQLSQLAEFIPSLVNRANALSLIKQSLADKKEALVKATAKADFDADLDIETQILTVKQREDALNDAKKNLAEYYIRAPFDGIITKVNSNIKKGDSVSTATTLATLITKQKIAEITLNEIDIAKVKVGQKATITFDAVENLSITGEVVEIDALGTVTQGVVTYNLKIAFDADDERVKPGMSLSVAIITDVKQNVLLVSNSAIKYQGDVQYVEIMENETPRSQIVEVGISNDTMSEIISGLKEGDKVVTQTISSSTTKTSTTQNSGLQIPGTSVPGNMQMQRMMR